MRGVRARLLVTIVGLVALTSVVLGAGAYLYVATSLRGQQQEQAVAQTDFNVGVLADQVLPADATKQDVVDTGLIDAFELRGGAGIDRRLRRRRSGDVRVRRRNRAHAAVAGAAVDRGAAARSASSAWRSTARRTS